MPPTPPDAALPRLTRDEVLARVGDAEGREVDLSGFDLRELDLSGRKLARVRFAAADGSRPALLDGACFDRTRLVRVDLGGTTLARVDFGGAELDDVRFGGAGLDACRFERARLRGVRFEQARLADVSFEAASLEDVGFGRARLERVGFRAARLHDVRFESARLTEARLTRAQLDDCRFVRAQLDACDLRRAHLAETTLDDAVLSDCDLYRIRLAGGVVFGAALLRRCSLTRATLDGAVDLTAENFDPSGPPLVQEAPEPEYRSFLARTAEEASREEGRTVRERLKEAAEGYRRLSGLWTERGAFGDAGWAYFRARRCERRWLSPRAGQAPNARHVVRWLVMCGVELLTGYGERARRTLAAVLALVLGPAVAYATLGGLARAPADGAAAGAPVTGFLDCLLFSVGQLVTQPPAGMVATGRPAEWVGALQPLLGIVLLGLLGFVLGNRIRHA